MFVALIIICLQLSSVNGYCQSKTFMATEDTRTIEHTYYRNNEDCIFTIQPSNIHNQYFDYSNYVQQWKKYLDYRRFDFFLEIIWESFDVKGSMPSCVNDYVEIFLTKSQNSIGRFCSDNLSGSKLFKMYAYDGYAKIKFHSDGSKRGKGFKLSMRLRSTSSNYLQYQSSSDWCNEAYMNMTSSFYSPRWPHEYQAERGTPCKYKINLPSTTKKIIFMDLNITRYNPYLSSCYANLDDNIQIRGSSSSSVGFEQANVIKGPLCGTSNVVSVITKYRYVYVHFKRPLDYDSRRGFVAGYVSYTDEPSVVSPVIVIGSIAGAACLLIVIIGIICCCCYRRSKKSLGRNQERQVQNETSPNVTYSGFQPPNAYQGPYQVPETYPGGMPPPYSAYDPSAPKLSGKQTSGHIATVDNLQQQRPPAYNPAYSDRQQQPTVNTHLLP